MYQLGDDLGIKYHMQKVYYTLYNYYYLLGFVLMWKTYLHYILNSG